GRCPSGAAPLPVTRAFTMFLFGGCVHERLREFPQFKSHRHRRLMTHLLIERPDTFDPRGSEQGATVRDHGTELLCSRRSLHEQPEIEVWARGFTKRDPIVVGPALRVVAAIRPLVLPR